MQGFKSFAEPVTIEFDKGITCVVGPNGSGKSNISDAIRWVLGEQSPKMLRGGKMEDIIFAGTSSRKSRGMAEVTLVIDNSTGILPIDYNEVAITRRMYRSGESEYAINNNQCRMRDIRELLMDTGIGVDGYSLIGQGQIADIISNKSDSIRDIFEETAGIVSYRTKKAEAERKLSSTNSNMERVNDIIREIEGRIGGLKDDSEKAALYLELRDRYKELEINITLKNIENIERKNREFKDDAGTLQNEIEEIRTSADEIEKNLGKDREKNEELEKQCNERRARLLDIIEEINSLVNRSEVNGERLASIEKNNRRLLMEIAALEEKLSKEKKDSKEQFESKERIERELALLSDALEEKIADHAGIYEALNKKTEETEQLKERLFRLHGDISSKKAEMKSLQNLKDTLKNRRVEVLEQKENGESHSISATSALKDAKAKRDSLSSEMDRIREDIEKTRKSYNDIIQNERSLAGKLEELKIEISRLSSRKKTIEEMESNYEGYNNAVKFIMRSETGGIHGVVAELINVPEGYEVAMETALGAALQNIICENDIAAREAINQLKHNKAGRLTFLPMNSIRPGRKENRDDLIKMPGFMGYAVDRIGFDQKYKSVMDYLLGRVVIADNMDNAILMSKKTGGGLRYVTLEGEIINSGGAITGGRYKNKTANLLERKAEIFKMETRLKEMSSEKQKLEEDQSAMRRALEEKLVVIKENEEIFREKEREFFAGENEVKVMQTALDDFENSSEKWQRELANIDREQALSDETVKKLDIESKELEGEIKKTEREIENLSEMIEKEKQTADAAGEEITGAKIALGAAESEKTKIDAIVNRINETINEAEKEKEIKTGELEQLKKERESILSGVSSNEGLVHDKEEEKERLSKELEEMDAEKSSTGKRMGLASQEREELLKKITALQDNKYEAEIRIARQETQLENYKEKLWEEFEISYIQAIEFKKQDFIMAPAVKENREIKTKIKELGEVNVGAIKEYKTVKERYDFLNGQKNDIETSMNELLKIIEDMDKIIKARFKESFDRIAENFELVFKEFFGGGTANIRLDNEEDPLNAVIEITAQPPGKQLRHINLLSGGEKTMTAIALMFAVLKTKPTPCCILDEVEAALDDSNIDIFANYLKNFDDIQFTLITHQKATMEHADVMYGVTMPERGISKIYSLSLGEEPLM